MQPVGFTPRVLTLFFIFLLGLPNPAFALRMTQSVQSGLEEGIAEALSRSPSKPAAGLEEWGRGREVSGRGARDAASGIGRWPEREARGRTATGLLQGSTTSYASPFSGANRNANRVHPKFVGKGLQ